MTVAMCGLHIRSEIQQPSSHSLRARFAELLYLSTGRNKFTHRSPLLDIIASTHQGYLRCPASVTTSVHR